MIVRDARAGELAGIGELRVAAYRAGGLLSAQPAMTAAQHLYRLAGFTRLPELDWRPAPGLSLLAFGLVLPLEAASADRQRPQRISTSYAP